LLPDRGSDLLLAALHSPLHLGTWRLTEQAPQITIPDTLQGVIMARIDRLDDDLKQLLRLASVVGRSFLYRVLASITAAERELEQSLVALEARELIVERARLTSRMSSAATLSPSTARRS
jgi:predicted ATPase